MATSGSNKSPVWVKQRRVMLSNWELMRQNGLLTDLTIVCGDKKFKVHHGFVCASIPFFSKMYQTSPESMKDIIELSSVTANAMSIIVDFIYTGVAAEIKDNVKCYDEILHATHLLQVESLFDEYYRAFCKLVEVNRFTELLSIAEIYGGDGFAAMITFLARNFLRITAADEFLTLSLSHLQGLLNHTQLKEESTTSIVQAILSWVKFKEDERQEHLECLFSFIDLDTLSVEYLQMLTQDNMLVKNNHLVYNKLIAAVLAKLSLLPNIKKQLMCFGKINGASVTATYSLKNSTWSDPKIPDFNWEFGMTVAKYLDKYYVFGGGGWEDSYVPSNSIYKYDADTNTAVKLYNLQVPVNQAGAGALGGYLYVVGGRGKNNALVADVQRVEPTNGLTLVVAPTIQLHNAPSVIPFRDYLYAVGSAPDDFSCVERYNPVLDEWTVVTVVPEAIDWCQATLWEKRLVVCSRFDEKLYVFDFESECWEIRDFSSAPASGVWGLWTSYCQNAELPFLLIRDGSGMFRYYDADEGVWMGSLGLLADPMLWPVCVMT